MKIALVAMSGVRVKSRELFDLGVTLPGFVERSKVIASLPSLGLLTLAGATPRGHELVYMEHGDRTPERLADERFDLVAVSTFTAQAPEAYAFTDACRARSLRTVIGGLHASVLPEEAGAHADHVIAGEGEEAWPELLADLEAGRSRALYDARGRVFDFARAPLPRYDLLDIQRYNRITVQTARSCPHRCIFCASGVLLRGPYRRKPVELVVRDLEAISARWPHPFIELADDNTFVDKTWGKRIARAFVPFRMKWFTETDITIADDEELLSLLAESGCRQVLVGLEDVEREAVAGIESVAFKADRVARYGEAVRRIQEHGVSVNGTFILGLDHHAPSSFARIAAFAEEVGLAEVQVTVLTPFPGTPLHAKLASEGRLLAPSDWGACTLFDVTYRPARMTPRELEEGLMETMRRLYAPDRVRARQRSFHAMAVAGARRRRSARRGRPAA